MSIFIYIYIIHICTSYLGKIPARLPLHLLPVAPEAATVLSPGPTSAMRRGAPGTAKLIGSSPAKAGEMSSMADIYMLV